MSTPRPPGQGRSPIAETRGGAPCERLVAGEDDVEVDLDPSRHAGAEVATPSKQCRRQSQACAGVRAAAVGVHVEAVRRRRLMRRLVGDLNDRVGARRRRRSSARPAPPHRYPKRSLPARPATLNSPTAAAATPSRLSFLMVSIVFLLLLNPRVRITESASAQRSTPGSNLISSFMQRSQKSPAAQSQSRPCRRCRCRRQSPLGQSLSVGARRGRESLRQAPAFSSDPSKCRPRSHSKRLVPAGLVGGTASEAAVLWNSSTMARMPVTGPQTPPVPQSASASQTVLMVPDDAETAALGVMRVRWNVVPLEAAAVKPRSRGRSWPSTRTCGSIEIASLELVRVLNAVAQASAGEAGRSRLGTGSA